MTWMYIILPCLMCVVYAQDELYTLPDGVTLPPELQQKIGNGSELEAVKSKYLGEFKKKCEKNGHPEAYENVQAAANNLMTCISSLVDKETLEKEIEDAKPEGKVDEVFKKYCGKTPQFKECFRNMTETIKPCFAPDEQKNFKTVHNVTDQLAEFICYKDGDRIALFIAEGGTECFTEQQERIQNCFNSTFDSKTQGELENITMDGIFDLEFKEEQCNQIADLRKCIVEVLEKCTKPTSANIMDSLFKFIVKATPCKKYNVGNADAKSRNGQSEVKSNQKAAASGIAVTTSTIIMALAAALLL